MILDSLATTAELAELFSDRSVLQAMLDFEAALARAEAQSDVIPETAVGSISQACRAEYFDPAQIAERGLRTGTVAIPLVKALTERVRATDADAAGYVHWGSTSQDVADTAIVLLLWRALPMLAADHERLQRSLHRLSEDHATTVMIGRTLLQPAPPVTFGLKAAGWYGALERCWSEVKANFEEARVLQFGGASGTLAALGEQGPAVTRALATELGLTVPAAPWHTHRDRFAGLLCACGVYTASLSKMARDISLLMQAEINEASEPSGDGRGGSSAMPHKRNPTACSIALAAATRVPGMIANFLFGMAQEHERAAGYWQAEWPTIAGVIQATGVALASMREVAEGLTVNGERMRANIEATRGLIFAERVAILAGKKLGRDRAYLLVEEASQRSIADGRNLMDVLAASEELSSALSRDELATLNAPEEYLGCAEIFRRRLLGQES